MAIILPRDHPAFSRLLAKNVAVRTDSGAGPVVRPVIRLGFVNLMPMAYLDETADLLLARMACANADVRPVFIHPLDARKGCAWEAARREGLDAVLITGYAAAALAFEDLDFWPGVQKIFSDCAVENLPLFAVCAGAMAAAYYFYGVGKEQAPHKLLGNYEYITPGGQSLFLATSRHNTLNRAQLLGAMQKTGLRIAAQTKDTPQPEPGVLIDGGRRIVLTLAHLEYGDGRCDSYPGFEGRALDILRYQYLRDHAAGPGYDPCLAARVRPVVNPVLSPAQVRARECYAAGLFTGWVEAAARPLPLRRLDGIQKSGCPSGQDKIQGSNRPLGPRPLTIS